MKKRRGDLLGGAEQSQMHGVSSTDTAPALMALGRTRPARLQSGEREISLAELYNNDGMNYLRRKPDEIIAEVLFDSLHGWRSTYWKCGGADHLIFRSCQWRPQRGSARTASWMRLASVIGLRLRALSLPRRLQGFLWVVRLQRKRSWRLPRLLRVLLNHWITRTRHEVGEKRVTAEFVTYALRELRGDDVTSERAAITRMPTIRMYGRGDP